MVLLSVVLCLVRPSQELGPMVVETFQSMLLSTIPFYLPAVCISGLQGEAAVSLGLREEHS